jgi:RNA polymerase sigma-70 factor (ECF subfamily)
MAEIPPTRASLLVRLRDPRDQGAWQEFVTLYAPLVYGYVRRQGLQDADAADLGQEVLCAVAGAVTHLEYNPGRGSFRNWLFTIVRRRLSNWRRSERARLPGRHHASLALLEQCVAAPEESAEWEAEWQQRVFAWACAQVRQEVTDLTWQAFWRTAIDGQPGKMVAADLGLTVTVVYHIRSRVRARLKELVQSVQDSGETP